MGLTTELRFHKAEMFFFYGEDGKQNNQQGEPTIMQRLKLVQCNAATSFGTLLR